MYSVDNILTFSFLHNNTSHVVTSVGLRAFVQLNCTALPGTVGVTKGDSVVTTSVDLRDYLNIGDTVTLGSEQYEVVISPDR